MVFFDRDGTRIQVGDYLITSNDDPRRDGGMDVWTEDDYGEVQVTEICSHGISTRKDMDDWEPECFPDEDTGMFETIYGSPYIKIVR